MGRNIKSTSPPKRNQKVSNCVKNLEKLADAERESQSEKRKTLDSTLESLSPPNKMPNNAQPKDANVTAPALEQLLGQLRLNIKADTQVVIDQAVQSANSELKDEITAVADDVKDVAATMAKMDARLSSRMDNFDLRLEDNDDRLRLVMRRLDEKANTTKEVRGELQDLRDEMVSGNYNTSIRQYSLSGRICSNSISQYWGPLGNHQWQLFNLIWVGGSNSVCVQFFLLLVVQLMKKISFIQV